MKNIVLIGFMGTGKSEVGRRLAKALGWRFLDTDRLIERESGLRIPSIFDKYGEDTFRKMERTVIEKLAGERKVVVATGGGAVMDPANLRNLRSNGVIVCLKASPADILSRVSGSDRPLLKGKNPRRRVLELLASRQAQYARADFTVETTGRTPERVSKRVLSLVRGGTVDRVSVDLPGRGYEIHIGSGTLSKLGESLAGLGLSGRVAVVTNPRIGKLYGGTVSRSLKKAGFAVQSVFVPDGERYKTLKSAAFLYDALVRHRFERNSCLVALGGGVIGDLGGFTAATYLRGIPFVQVPTTLAAQVDASIGGKTGVNHPLGKNLIGAFYQPRLVYIDTRVLGTLSRREYVSGLAEVIKYGVISDAEFFKELESGMEDLLKLEEGALRRVIRRSCEIKAGVVGRDEKEGGVRRILNYGHTLGHAVESVTRYRRYLHGEAVALGMAFAARLARNLKVCDDKTVLRQVRLVERAGLPVKLPRIKTADIIKSMKRDKKILDGSIHFVLADRIGHVVVRPVSEGRIRLGLRAGQKEEKRGTKK